MGYGKKRWVVVPPFNGSYYSVKPALDFFTQDLPVLEEAASRGDGEVFHFTQHSGDIVVLPREWGHATLNIESSIGLAYEFIYRPYSAPVDTTSTAETIVKEKEVSSGTAAVYDQPYFPVEQLERQFPSFMRTVAKFGKRDFEAMHQMTRRTE